MTFISYGSNFATSGKTVAFKGYNILLQQVLLLWVV